MIWPGLEQLQQPHLPNSGPAEAGPYIWGFPKLGGTLKKRDRGFYRGTIGFIWGLGFPKIGGSP